MKKEGMSNEKTEYFHERKRIDIYQRNVKWKKQGMLKEKTEYFQERKRINIYKGMPNENEKSAFSKTGDAGNRTPCLSHAKRALYHMSYVPILITVLQVFQIGYGPKVY